MFERLVLRLVTASAESDRAAVGAKAGAARTRWREAE
jgi:hypothetical protein